MSSNGVRPRVGIQTRIDSRARSLACAAHTGNIYINAT